MVRAGSIEEVQAAVRAHARLRPVGGRTKPALSADAALAGAAPARRTDAVTHGFEAGSTTQSPAEAASGARDAADGRGEPVLFDVAQLSGVLDYSAAECTFGARAGTTIAEIERMLARDGLYLPFEPPFGDRGATLGGTVAAGLSGPGRLRYGGVRDFLLGVRFVDGEGRVAQGGGRVVKNAAGFSMQHLLLGSLGRLGVLVELTFKVFPRPPAQRTIVAEFDTFAGALDALVRLRRSTFEPDAAELLPARDAANSAATLLVRLAGIESALDARVSALNTFLAADRVVVLAPADADAFWHAARELTWCPSAASAPGLSLVKVPITPSRVARLEGRLRQHAPSESRGTLPAGAAVPHAPDGTRAGVARRYGAGGEVAWIAWPGPLDPLHRLLREDGLQGLVLIGGDTGGETGGEQQVNPLIGAPSDAAFLARVRQALDPRGVFA